MHNFEAHPFSLFAGFRQHYSSHDEFGPSSVIPGLGMDFAGRVVGIRRSIRVAVTRRKLIEFKLSVICLHFCCSSCFQGIDLSL